jgi:hypothetical protein
MWRNLGDEKNKEGFGGKENICLICTNGIGFATKNYSGTKSNRSSLPQLLPPPPGDLPSQEGY